MIKRQRIVIGTMVGGAVGLVFCGITWWGSDVTAWVLMPISIPMVLVGKFITVNLWAIAAGTIGYFAGLGWVIARIGQSGLRHKRTLHLIVLVVLIVAHVIVYQIYLSRINEVAAKALVDALSRGTATKP